MNFQLDIHIHTIASTHAYSTLSENAAHAASIGLTHIGVAEHGPAMPDGAHLYNFLNSYCIPNLIHGVHVLKGAEANIVNHDGEIDLPLEALKKLDFVIASLHRGVLPSSTCELNTQAMVQAMQNPNVHILGHPNSANYPVDMEVIVKAAAKTRTIIEINNQTLAEGSIRFEGTKPMEALLQLCKQHGVSVLASSDAHFCTSVGDFRNVKPLIEASGIPEALVVNTSVERLFAAIELKKRMFR